ncbi:MAG: hypothetical protein E7107_10450 [Prevotella sp.]|nr:hypothetical protein [Prevotella sp.]
MSQTAFIQRNPANSYKVTKKRAKCQINWNKCRETENYSYLCSEKVGQLFYVRPECLDTTIHFNLPSTVDASTDDIKAIKLQAGADIVLGPQNFVEAFDAVVKAVENGTLTEQRIDQSVRRILRLKKQIGR